MATTTRLSRSRPSWSVPNQCAHEGGCERLRLVLLASGSYGTIQGPTVGQHHQQHEEAEGEPGHRVLAEHVAAVAQQRAHASILARGSITP